MRANRSVVPLLAGLLLALAAACGTPQTIGQATVAGKKFHERLNAQDAAAIYADADPQFRQATKLEDLTALVNRVHDRLGAVTDPTRTGFNVNFNAGGSTITLTYSTKFQLGEAQETFLWRKQGESMKLLNYRIQSSALNDANLQ
ncbi:MAG TPA: hypothetical protein VMT51_02485 [Dongiaceae bacterium]|nr:hypothetical protein [Dongiaceae bacterium]